MFSTHRWLFSENWVVEISFFSGLRLHIAMQSRSFLRPSSRFRHWMHMLNAHCANALYLFDKYRALGVWWLLIEIFKVLTVASRFLCARKCEKKNEVNQRENGGFSRNVAITIRFSLRCALYCAANWNMKMSLSCYFHKTQNAMQCNSFQSLVGQQQKIIINRSAPHRS